MTHTIRARELLVAVLVLGAACTPRATVTSPGPTARYDVIIENGRLVDGTGNAWRYADVAIDRDRIVRVAPAGMLTNARADVRIDATGLVVAPGFIDIQAQSGGTLLRGDSRLVSTLTQGITTVILGEGSTPAPANELTQGPLPADRAAAESLRRLRDERGFDWWLRAMESRGISPNVGSFVGAGTLRQYGMGMALGAAPPAALDSMRRAVRNAMQDGAFGIASALIYAPGNYASTEELIELAEAMAPYGGLYITHMRSEADKLLEAIDESMRIGREAGVPVEIYHLKGAGIRNWPKVAQAIAKIDSARAAGQDVSADMYPYTAAGTGLTACLPPWAAADGKLFENLADSAVRARILLEVAQPTSDWENLCELAMPENVLVTSLRSPQYGSFAGRRLAEIAAAGGKDWVTTVMDLILAERNRVSAIYFLMSEENVQLQLRQPWMKFGTDAGGYDPDSSRALVHPRGYGTYPRILGRYVRDEAVLPLEDAVRKMSSAVASRLSISERGEIHEGWFADVVVFDPAMMIDRSTFEEPHQLSVGIRHVFVNGEHVVRDGEHTGAKPGRALRGPGWSGWWE